MKDSLQWRAEWLSRHRFAEVIVMTDYGVPVRAEYRTLGTGRLFPVAYLYPSDEGVNL